MEQEKLLERLMGNKEFTDKLAAAESFEEAVKLFATEGVSITAEELKKFAVQVPAEGELDESALDNVAGGRVNLFQPIAKLVNSLFNNKKR